MAQFPSEDMLMIQLHGRKGKEDNLSNASHIQISDSQGISNNMEPCCQEASVSHPPLSEGNTKCTQQKSIASSKVKQIINKTIKHGNEVKDKATVASAITNKAKVCSITTKVAVMKSKPNPSLR
ncbi:hypothetical protein J1N35_044371 [Gossypium stocksii]|uniref:Uncharacterized protein n=1 Tax=Gossypium stocksii TaxID=47602 RepID=A0A9D3ZG61_9ROSI|nr:hypothetical protein J1N35_044371 [Gossypium stocksii]